LSRTKKDRLLVLIIDILNYMRIIQNLHVKYSCVKNKKIKKKLKTVLSFLRKLLILNLNIVMILKM